ncbi:MAG: ABC transporter permease [Prolixibacteraceae bacterium]|nr:ABC transporter permease [Burkholderiales bacterium]
MTAGTPKASDQQVAAKKKKRRQSQLLRLARDTLPAWVFIALIAAWWAAVEIVKVPAYLLPPPQDVLPRIYEGRVSLFNHSMVTIQEIILGFGLSVITAIPLGLLIALSPTAKRMLYPLLVFIQLVPKIAIAPLFVVWLGFGLTSKVMLTLLLTFFPLLLASMAGFQILDQRLLYLTRSMGATTWQTFRYLRFPAALPVIFGGLKTSATIAATAAIVAEFVGSNKGLGYVLLQGTANLDTTLVFAVLFLLTIIGLALNTIVEVVEYFMTPWQRNQSKA